MKLRNLGSSAAIDDIRVEGIWRDVTVFDDTHWMPIPESDRAVIAPAQGAGRAAFLLPPANTVGKGVRSNCVIELRCRLVVPRTPTRAAIHRDDRALVTDHQNNVAVVGIDPKILVVIAAGRTAESRPGFASIGRAHGDGADHVNEVGILRVDLRDGEIATANATRRTRISGDLRPGIARVIRAVDAEFPRSCCESCVQAAWFAGC